MRCVYFFHTSSYTYGAAPNSEVSWLDDLDGGFAPLVGRQRNNISERIFQVAVKHARRTAEYILKNKLHNKSIDAIAFYEMMKLTLDKSPTTAVEVLLTVSSQNIVLTLKISDTASVAFVTVRFHNPASENTALWILAPQRLLPKDTIL